jgi:hypothetical protein
MAICRTPSCAYSIQDKWRQWPGLANNQSRHQTFEKQFKKSTGREGELLNWIGLGDFDEGYLKTEYSSWSTTEEPTELEAPAPSRRGRPTHRVSSLLCGHLWHNPIYSEEWTLLYQPWPYMNLVRTNKFDHTYWALRPGRSTGRKGRAGRRPGPSISTLRRGGQSPQFGA